MSSIKSVHLQNFPNLDDFETDQKLVDKMDKVRAICSCALFVRDKNNLRVRLPLNKITIIGKNIEEIKEFSNIIIDEINVKNIEFIENIDDFSTKKLILDFKKIIVMYLSSQGTSAAPLSLFVRQVSIVHSSLQAMHSASTSHCGLHTLARVITVGTSPSFSFSTRSTVCLSE